MYPLIAPFTFVHWCVVWHGILNLDDALTNADVGQAEPAASGAQQDSSSSSSSSDSSTGTKLRLPSADAPPVSPKAEAKLTLEQYQEIYDRLIAIFQQRPRDDWKKLIVFSKQWPEHKQGVFDRSGRVAGLVCVPIMPCMVMCQASYPESVPHLLAYLPLAHCLPACPHHPGSRSCQRRRGTWTRRWGSGSCSGHCKE
jgi:hypothetical protein